MTLEVVADRSQLQGIGQFPPPNSLVDQSPTNLVAGTHFTEEHRGCLDQKFDTFSTEDSKSHMVEVHDAEVPSRDRRGAWGSLRTHSEFENFVGYCQRALAEIMKKDSSPQLQPPSARHWLFGASWTADTPASSGSIPHPTQADE